MKNVQKDERSKRNEKKIKKAGMTVLSVSVLTAGTVGIVSAYQNGQDYKPSKNERDIQDNQVVFSDDDTVGHKKNKKKDNSELLKKKKDGDSGAKNEENPGYLFENSSLLMPENNTLAIASEETGLTSSGNTSNGTIYNLTGDSSNADILINGGSNGGGTGTGTDGDSKNTGTGSQTDGTDKGNQNNGNGNTGNGGNHSDQENVRPSAVVKDPDTEKKTPTQDGVYNYNPYVEGIEPAKETDENGENESVIIMPSFDAEADMIYKGQSVDEKIIYNALDTFVVGKEGKAFLWGEKSYGTYIKITAVSFDGGNTWNEQFPMTVPADIEEGGMKIRVEYRLSVNDTKWGTRIVDYEPKDIRLFILSREVAEGEEKIDPATILNAGKQYLDIGEKVNLLSWENIETYLGTDRLTQLFPGWMEDGKLVPWIYEVTGGRHVLEPASMIPLDSSYVVKLETFWMSDDYMVGGQYSNYCYLQTLTDMDTPWKANWSDDEWQAFSSYNVLNVPRYIQAVKIGENAGLSVNYITIPDTVLYIETQNSGMRVNQGYIVDKDNLNYSSTEEGLLMNKAETEILNIPYGKMEITIPDSVEKVQMEKKNQLKKITVKRTSGDELPEISYGNLKNCKIVVNEEFLEEILKNYPDDFSRESGNTVASVSDEAESFFVENGMIVNEEGDLRKVIPTANKSVKLSDHIKHVQEHAFSENEKLTSIIMPQSGKTIQFEKGSLENSNIDKILCYKKEQYDHVVNQVTEYGLTDITVEMIQTSMEGYGYSTEYEDGIQKNILVNAPVDVEVFEGKVTADDGTAVEITEIGDNAFDECENLRWAFLPESVEEIGSQAFYGCSNLQGIMIRNTEKITIGYGAIDNCASLRFVGSNAMDGEFLDDYNPEVTDKFNTSMKYFYVPTGSTGYAGNCTSFTENSGVYGYDVVSDGGNGWILYGLDNMGDPWIALRSGKNLPEELNLPETSSEIFAYAFAGTKVEKGDYYTVNFEDTMLEWIDDGAFQSSDIGKDIVLNEDSVICDKAFYDCENIESADFPGTGNLALGMNVLSECKNLKTVRIGEIGERDYLYTGLFDGCPELTDIYFENEIPPAQAGMMASFGFHFNNEWTGEEESQKLKIHVPEGSEKAYVKAWRYGFAGYLDYDYQPAYLSMWEDVRMENINWDTWEFPENSVVDEKLKEKLLMYENRLRTMLGTENVDEPVDFYPYHKDDWGMLYLAGVPSDVTKVDLYDTELMGLPEGWYFDGIEPYAFAGTKGLKEIVLPYTLAELSNNVFAGIETDSLTVTFDQYWAIDLVLEDGQPYSFGLDDSVLHFEVPEEVQDEYLQAWSYKLAGYEDLETMRTAVRAELTAEGKEPSEEDVDTEIADRLLPQVNRLRRIMGLETVEKLDAEAFGLNVKAESETGDEPVDQEKPDKEISDQKTSDQKTSDKDKSEEQKAENADQSGATDPEDQHTQNDAAEAPAESETGKPEEKEEKSISVQAMSGSWKETDR